MTSVLPTGKVWTKRQTHIEGRQHEETQEKHHMTLEAKIEIMLPHDKKCLWQPKAGRGKQ